MHLRAFLILSLALAALSCAALQPVSTNGPRRNQPPYPAILPETKQRTDAAQAAWLQIASQQGIPGKPEVTLHPIIDTITSLPENLGGTLYLPKVGTTSEMSAEETRESLRRLLREWRPLLGADPNQLSLVEESKNADGVRIARYEQKPFIYPLRGDYGKVEVRYTSDRRILNVSSNAIPSTDKIQPVLSGAALQVKADEVPAKLVGRAITYSDSTGTHTLTLENAAQVTVQQLVVYPIEVAGNPAEIRFYLAWEVTVTNAPIKLIYLDALEDEVIATKV